MRRTLLATTTASVIASCAGCGTTVIFVPDGTPVRLAEPVHTHVYVYDGQGNLVRSPNKVTLPAGWWAAPVPEDQPESTIP